MLDVSLGVLQPDEPSPEHARGSLASSPASSCPLVESYGKAGVSAWEIFARTEIPLPASWPPHALSVHVLENQRSPGMLRNLPRMNATISCVIFLGPSTNPACPDPQFAGTSPLFSHHTRNTFPGKDELFLLWVLQTIENQQSTVLLNNFHMGVSIAFYMSLYISSQKPTRCQAPETWTKRGEGSCLEELTAQRRNSSSIRCHANEVHGTEKTSAGAVLRE